MTKATVDAETILKRAAPLIHQQAHEIQPFGHLVRMPIALGFHVSATFHEVEDGVDAVVPVDAQNASTSDFENCTDRSFQQASTPVLCLGRREEERRAINLSAKSDHGHRPVSGPPVTLEGRC